MSPPRTPQSLEGSASPTATASVQRFSLRSRSARLRVPKNVGAVSCRRLQLPAHLRNDACQCVRICDCTADPCLGVGRRRLCKQATDDHDEFRLLELLNSRFIADCRSGGTFIATRASLSEINIFFILEPLSNAVMGYAAIVPACEHGILPGGGGQHIDDLAGVTEATSGRLPLLSQLFVEPQARRKGLATAALRVLLAGQKAAVVACPSLATAN